MTSLRSTRRYMLSTSRFFKARLFASRLLHASIWSAGAQLLNR